MTESEFQQQVINALEPHAAELVSVLRQLVEYDYPPEVASVDFEVFCDGFTSGFPVRAFFMDRDNTEFFVYVNGEAQYPSPVDPGLVKLRRVYDGELENRLFATLPDADDFTLAGQALIPWFARCWVEAGGLDFGRLASIRLHDDLEHYNLVEQGWAR